MYITYLNSHCKQQTDLDLVPALFVSYFRQLPNPIIPTRIYNRCINFFEKNCKDPTLPKQLTLILLCYVKSLSDKNIVY